MTTPVLTKVQQKKSLSSKKGPVKGLKNVLAQPHENYWPLLKHDHCAELENLLKRSLPILKRSEIKIPWSQLRKMSKEERSAAKKAAQLESNIDNNDSVAKSVVFGINAVTRLLEKNDVCCVLLDANVDPSLLVKHIVTMARDKNVPVLLINFLKKVTLETIGYSSAAIGLKTDVQNSSENHFYALFKKVSELLSELPSSKIVVSLFQNDSVIEDMSNNDETCVESMEIDVKETTKPGLISTDVYLYRTSKKERIFEPSNSSKNKNKVEMGEWAEFIALDDDDNYDIDKKKMPMRFFQSTCPDGNRYTNSNKTLYKTSTKVMGMPEKTTVQSNKCKVSYKPLKVKRLQGNECRTKATKPPKVKKK